MGMQHAKASVMLLKTKMGEAIDMPTNNRKQKRHRERTIRRLAVKFMALGSKVVIKRKEDFDGQVTSAEVSPEVSE